MYRKLLITILIIAPIFGFSQAGTSGVYSFLNIANSARSMSLGGYSFAIADDDLNHAIWNPSLITDAMHNNLSLNAINYQADIKAGNASYAYKIKKYGVFTSSIGYLSYGKFTESDPYGQEYGEFTCKDYAIQAGYAHKLLNNISGGVNLRYIHSKLYDEASSGLSMDVSASYVNPEKQFCVSLVGRNVGVQLTTYTGGKRERLPMEIHASMSKKLEKAPLRLIVTAANLQKWDLTNEDITLTKIDPFTKDTIKGRSKIESYGDKLMRHMVFGFEIVPNKNISVRLAYNYRTRKDMVYDVKPKLIGFSFGLGIKVKKINISYGRSMQYLGNAVNQFTVSANLGEFFVKSTPNANTNN